MPAPVQVRVLTGTPESVFADEGCWRRTFASAWNALSVEKSGENASAFLSGILCGRVNFLQRWQEELRPRAVGPKNRG